MAEPGLILVTGAGGGVGGVGGKVVALLRQRGKAVRAMAHHDDDRADTLRALGADVVVGDLLRPADVATGPRLGPTDVLQHEPRRRPTSRPAPPLRRWPVRSATWRHSSPSLR